MIRLVYVSRAARTLTEAELQSIAESSQRRNGAAGISGLLVAQGDYFYGVMEGPRRRVLARMEVIITDDRHRNLNILREEAIRERRFVNWSFSSLPEGSARLADAAKGGGFIVDLSRRLM